MPPIKRTPPASPANLNVNLGHHSHSDPNLEVISVDEPAVSQIKRRPKVKAGANPIVTANCDCKAGITKMFSELQTAIKEVKAQNVKLQESVDFTATKYDEIVQKLNQVQQEREEEKNYIQLLEEKIEQLERQSRATKVEIRNVPKIQNESKQDLVNIIVNTGKSIHVPIMKADVKDVFRVKAKNATDKSTIIVELNSVLLKDHFLAEVKRFNRQNKEEKLNSGHLYLEGPKTPIFISENLTAKAKSLFFLARELALQYKYKYCWTSHGKVFLRKEDRSPFIRIETESDVTNLKSKA